MTFRTEHLAEGISLVLGDCRDFLASVPPCFRVDAVVTDPPYGVGLTHKQHKWFVQDGEGYAATDDSPETVESIVIPVIKRCIEIARNVVVTPGTRHLQKYPAAADIGTIFNKAGSGRSTWGFGCNHPVLFYGKCPYLNTGQGSRPNSWEQPPTDFSEKLEHPCPKPIGMMLWLVMRGSLRGETVLDPFMGSGTTGVAAVRLGRKFLGVELHEPYFDIACRRVSDALKQGDMFIEKPPPLKQEAMPL